MALIEIVSAALILAGDALLESKALEDDVQAVVDGEISLLQESAADIIDRVDRVDMAPTIERLKTQVQRVWWQVLLLVLPDEDELTWYVGATEESCDTCQQYDGQTKTVSEWRELAGQGIHPQGIALACLGYYCQCYFQ